MTIDEMKELTDISVIIANKEGIITYINEKFVEVFGFNRDEAIGENIVIIIPEELHDAHNMGFSRFVSTGKGSLLNEPLSLKARNKAGDEFDAEHFIIAEKRNDGWEIGSTVKPL